MSRISGSTAAPLQAPAQEPRLPADVASLAKQYDLGTLDDTLDYGTNKLYFFSGGTVDQTPGAPLRATKTHTYSVQPGDTLTAIAKKFGTSVDFVAAANELADPNKIFPGQELYVGLMQLVINPGDTLSMIADTYGTSVADLTKLNHLKDPNKIQAGALLTVPDYGAMGD